MRATPLIFAFAAVALLGGCNRQDSAQPAVAIHAGDTSVTCGMYIADAPGPRAEAYIDGAKTPLKFGSTRDLFVFAETPEMAHRMQSSYVQDTARIDWAHPSNSADTFIDARKAYYVGWQPLAGMMGPTFASFAKRDDANAFIQLHGGEVLTFRQVTPDVVAALGYHCPNSDHLAEACAVKPVAGVSHSGPATE